MAGIPEIPIQNDWPGLRRALSEMRNVLRGQQASQNNPVAAASSIANVPARPITNLRITPVAGGNVVDFTRSDGDTYTLYWSTSKDFALAVTVELGQSNTYNDNLGSGGVTRYYWIRARRQNGQDSSLVGPVAGMALTLGSATTLPKPLPATDFPAMDRSRGDKLLIS